MHDIAFCLFSILLGKPYYSDIRVDDFFYVTWFNSTWRNKVAPQKMFNLYSYNLKILLYYLESNIVSAKLIKINPFFAVT